MNIKSLLIGSAAALATVSGSYAADAVVAAEPEPMEYVRVCDAYGSGFFYIPGTETCLAISGYVWYQVGANSALTGPVNNRYGSTLTGFAKNVRARVNFDARSETEWGTLRSYIRLQASWNGVGDGPVAADQAWLSIGGLQMGYTESVWAASMNGGASNWGSHSWSGMSYGYQQRALIAYHFTGGNGLFGSISLEDDNNANWAPDVVAKVGMTQGWGAVWAKAAYDESAAGWAGSLGAQVNVPNMAGSNFRLIGYYASNANAYAVVDGFTQAFRWSVLASYNHQFNEKLGASLGFQYFGDANFAAAGSPNGWDVELSVVYMPVTNLEIRAELGYGSRDAGAFGAVPGAAFSGLNKGYLRVTRYF